MKIQQFDAVCIEPLQALADNHNALAGLAARVLSPAGQGWLQTFEAVLQKPSNQDVVNTVLDVAARYFSAARPEGVPDATLEELSHEAGN